MFLVAADMQTKYCSSVLPLPHVKVLRWQSNFPMAQADMQRNRVTEGKSFEQRRKQRFFRALETKDPPLGSACECDPRKWKDHHETNLVSILTDSYKATWR